MFCVWANTHGHVSLLVSRKLVQSDLCSEGSGTTKAGTDEQVLQGWYTLEGVYEAIWGG